MWGGQFGKAALRSALTGRGGIAGGMMRARVAAANNSSLKFGANASTSLKVAQAAASVQTFSASAGNGAPPLDIGNTGPDENAPDFSVPDHESACSMARKFREVSNDAVFMLAIMGKHGACRERLVREIMRVDKVSWQEARNKVEEMNIENDRYRWLAFLPYRVGIGAACIGGLGSLPFVFHKETVIWFAEKVVLLPPSEIPVEDLTTIWSVGSFAWGWAEPLLGTMSFVLLAAQLMRANMIHIGLSPYNDFIVKKRADRLVKLYPQYDRNVVKEFAITDRWNK